MSDSTLMRYFKFDEADLDANRNGRLSPKQAARLKGERGSFKSKARIIGGVIGLASLAGLAALYLSGVLNDSGILLYITPLFFLFPLGVAGFLLFGRFANRDYSVKQVEGPIQLAMNRTYNKDGTTNQHYALRVGGQSFVAEPDLSKVMTDGERYRVYYADDWSEILSAERA